MEAKTAKRGMPWATVLTILFIILKLTGAIAWPWLWVLCPLWIAIGIVLFLALIVGVISIIQGVLK
jgi:hypothetical protein